MWQQKIHVSSSMQNKDGYAMFLGRWQPLHDGHKQLFQQALDAGQNICIMIRDMPVDEKNPFTAEQIKENICRYFEESYATDLIHGVRVKVMIVPNITSVNFGRGVGYDIIEHIPPPEVAGISATNIREMAKGHSNACLSNTTNHFDGGKSCIMPHLNVPGRPNDTA